MEKFLKIFSAVLITINISIILILGAPLLAVDLILALNSGLSVYGLMKLLEFSSVVIIPLFSSIFSIYCYRREKYKASAFIGIMILAAISILICINFVDYKSAITG